MKGRIVRRVFTYGKVIHIGKEDCDLDDLLNAGARLGQDSLEICDALPSLLGDGSFNRLPVGSDGDLSGQVDGGGSLHGLRL